MVFEEHKKGNMNPAQILNHFIEGEEQYREVAALFHASLSESLNNEEQRRRFRDCEEDQEKQSGDTEQKSNGHHTAAKNHKDAVRTGITADFTGLDPDAGKDGNYGRKDAYV